MEDMKVMGDAEIAGDMAGRYRDVHFDATMRMKFISNANTVREFYHAFPVNLMTMPNNEVMALPFDTLALVKRFAFCSVPCCAIPEVDRLHYHQARSNVIEDVAAGMFSGSAALP